MRKYITILLALTALAFSSCGKKEEKKEEVEIKKEQPTESKKMTSEDTGVFFVELKDGQEVTSPFIVKMGVKGMVVEAAGAINEGKGHHHIIINEDFIADGTTVPKDATHIHFGKGQTETELTLEAGTYKLTLQFANGAHQSYGKELSTSIKVTVK